MATYTSKNPLNSKCTSCAQISISLQIIKEGSRPVATSLLESRLKPRHLHCTEVCSLPKACVCRVSTLKHQLDAKSAAECTFHPVLNAQLPWGSPSRRKLPAISAGERMYVAAMEAQEARRQKALTLEHVSTKPCKASKLLLSFWLCAPQTYCRRAVETKATNKLGSTTSKTLLQLYCSMQMKLTLSSRQKPSFG